MPRLLVLLSLAALMPVLAWAQAPEGSAEPPTPTADSEASTPVPAPPLVDADTVKTPTAASERDPTVRVPVPTVGDLPGPESSVGPALGSGILEFLGGGIAAAGLGVVGTAVLLGTLGAACAGEGCAIAALYLGGGLGAIIGAPVGVILTGALLGREGGIGMTLFGYMVGGTVGILGYRGLSAGHGNGNGAILLMLSMPLIGAVVGYEFSHAANVSGAAPAQPLRRRSAHWTPVAGVTPRGGFVGGLAGRF